MYCFCTYFDHRYLPRGLALYRSLQLHCAEFELWVLCLDDPCYTTLQQIALPGVHLITLEDLERSYPVLLAAKQNRTRTEYYFTCTPALPLFILEHAPAADMVTYLDADLFFFSSPAPVFEEIGSRSIAIIEHRYPQQLKRLECYGKYNVGWLSFRRDQQALFCLKWWRDRCIEWCYDRVEDGRFADQGYLDDWPDRFEGVVVIEHRGANLAPWNLVNYRLSKSSGHVWVEGQPLIFYHAQGLKQVNGWVFDPDLFGYGLRPSHLVLQDIYAPYMKALLESALQISPHLGQVPLLNTMRGGAIAPGHPFHRVLRGIHRVIRLISKTTFTREYFVFARGRIW